MQVNALYLWVCGPKPTCVPCPHEWAKLKLCDEFLRLNMVSELKVVSGMMWLTCEEECWRYFTCETRFHIDKIVGCELEYILGELILLLPYGFGKQWISPSVWQINALDPLVCWPEPTGVPCPHAGSTGRLYAELSRPNINCEIEEKVLHEW